jgi:hypothetical protein
MGRWGKQRLPKKARRVAKGTKAKAKRKPTRKAS